MRVFNSIPNVVFSGEKEFKKGAKKITKNFFAVLHNFKN